MGKQILRLNNSDDYEHFEIFLTEEKYPIAYANYLKSLIQGAGMTEPDARMEIALYPIELELYYEIDAGLMAVEAGAVESGTVFSPYSREEYQNPKGEDVM